MQHLEEGGTAIVYTINYALAKTLRDRMLDSYKQFTDRLYFVGNGGDHLCGLNVSDPTTRIFYDEFDFLDKDKVVWSKDGYYSTTCKYLRKPEQLEDLDISLMQDPLLCLLSMNDFCYENRTRDSSRGTMCDRLHQGEQGTPEQVSRHYLDDKGEIFQTPEYLLEMQIALDEQLKEAAEVEEYDDYDHKFGDFE